jgi:hypothetical protein
MKYLAIIANIKYIIEFIEKYILIPLGIWLKEIKNKKVQDAYEKRKEHRDTVLTEIATEAKNEPTPESDEALRNLHRKL